MHNISENKKKIYGANFLKTAFLFKFHVKYTNFFLI